MPLEQLHQHLHRVLPDARLQPATLPGLPELQLWLLDPANLDRAFSSDETRRLLEQPPYWGFCWGSGLALARWILDHPEQVRGKRVLDFGSGSGVVALACSAAGAACSIACDLDQAAQLACTMNAQINNLPLELSADYFAVDGELDLIVAADDARFSDPVVAMGVAGVEWFAHPWEMGPRRAKELLMTGDPFTAEDARASGMVNHVVPRAGLDAFTLDLAQRIAAKPAFALRMIKESVNSTLDIQGQRAALEMAFRIHQLCHAQNVEVHGHQGDPAGFAIKPRPVADPEPDGA